MAEVSWTKQSIKDIDNIAQFIAKNSEKYAKIQVERFFERAKILEEYPLSGRIVPEIQNKNIREIIIGNYRMIYKIKTKTKIDILTVHVGYMLIENSPVFLKKKNKK